MIEYVSKTPITKGWSGDKKYCVTTADGTKYLLRVSPAEQYDRKKTEFEMMQRVAALGVPMCQPVEFGTCDEGVYYLQSWIDGTDAEETLPSLSDTEQYELGIKAGKILRKMHTISASAPSDEWERIYNHRLNYYIDNYMKCNMKFVGDDLILDYINSNRYLLKKRPMCFAHGDYHAGNLMISNDKSLTVIDFNRYRMAEPYQSFGSIVFSARVSPLFATGQINGYFDRNIPPDFWKLMKLYLSAVAINGLPWSIPYGKDEIESAYKQIDDILSWYDNMKSITPTWYKQTPLPCFCGHDCSRCLTYLATVNNDDELRSDEYRMKSQRFYKEKFNLDIPLEKLRCLSGRSEDVFYLCKDCPWMKCAKEKCLSACSECAEYPCKPLAEHQEKYVNKCNQI